MIHSEDDWLEDLLLSSLLRLKSKFKYAVIEIQLGEEYREDVKLNVKFFYYLVKASHKANPAVQDLITGWDRSLNDCVNYVMSW